MIQLKSAARAVLLLAVAACTSDAGSPVGPGDAEPSRTLADAAHSGAVPGFYFLPPMVPAPTYSGTFDGALQPRVEICELSGSACGPTVAAFTFGGGSSSVRVDAAAQHYIANWNTPKSLDPAKFYRVQVFVGTFRLGYADVDVVRTGKEKDAVDRTQFVPLIAGQTLPVKFRIETGIAARVTVSPDSATVPAGGTQQFTATVTDLHGTALPGAPVAWSSSAPAVATVDGTGLATGVAPGQAAITATSGTASDAAALTVFNPNTPPVAHADTFQAIGNVTVPVAAPGVLANDTDGEGNVLQVVAGTYPTAAGGTVTLNADGGFSYRSAAGFTGTDGFTYTVTDGQDSATASATVTSAYRVWYVDNTAAAPGDGRDSSPFAALAGAESASSAGETVFVRTGSGAYGGGFALKNGQSLTGQGVPSSVTATLNGGTIVLLAAGGAPMLAHASGPAVQVASSNVVQGLDVVASAGAGIAGSGFGTLTVGSVSVTAAGGPALDLSSGDVFGAFSALSSAGSAGSGIRLVGVGGSFSAAGGSITGPAAAGVVVTGGAGSFSYGGDIAVAGPLAVSVTGRTGGALVFGGTIASTGQGIAVQNNSGGSVAFTGASKSLSTGANPGVLLANNTGAQVSFAGGGLVIGTTTGTGFEANGGGTVQVTGAGNAVTASGGTAVRLNGIGTGVSGLSFQSVSATGGTSAISVAGISGAGFQVTGDGSSAGSGGVIEGTSGDAVSFTGGGTVRLALMKLLPGGNGVVAADFSGSAVLERSVIDYRGAAVAGSYAVRLANAAGSGTFALDGTAVQNKLDGTAAVSVAAAGNAAISFAVRDSNAGDAFPSHFSNLFGSAVFVVAGDHAGSTARVTAVVRDSRFVNAAANGSNNVDLLVAQNAILDYTILDNVFDNVAKASAIVGVINVNALQGGRLGAASADSIVGNTIRNIGSGAAVAQQGFVGIRVAVDNSVPGVKHRLVIENNAITNLWRQGILVSSRDQSDDVNVRIRNNVVGTAAAPVARSNRRGVEVEAQSSSRMAVEVLNNNVVNTSTAAGNSALQIRSVGASSHVSATVLGNTLGNTNAAITAGRFRAETLSGTAAGACLDLRNNTLDGAARLFEAVAASTGTFHVEGPGAAVVTPADLTAANTAGTGSVIGAPLFNNNINCTQPSL